MVTAITLDNIASVPYLGAVEKSVAIAAGSEWGLKWYVIADGEDRD